jgi:hypothetical protein
MIFSEIRDPRFITVRRGGTLQDADHRLLAVWAAVCAQHVLHFFEQVQPDDDRPRRAIEQAHAWVRGEITMTQSRAAGGHAMGAARVLSGPAREAAYAAGQAAVVAHVAAHELGAATYAIRAARAAAPKDERIEAGRLECQWERSQLPVEIRELVLDDQRLRNKYCWFVFDC